jgi:hypothetical protein
MTMMQKNFTSVIDNLSFTFPFTLGNRRNVGHRRKGVQRIKQNPSLAGLLYMERQSGLSWLDGRFCLRWWEPGFIKLQVTSVGFEPSIRRFQFTNANKAFVEIPMQGIKRRAGGHNCQRHPSGKEESLVSALKLKYRD